MNAGYVRLSRDDDHKNYVSIENQKLIINQYAADHGAVIDRWYEDDGISGYIFDLIWIEMLIPFMSKIFLVSVGITQRFYCFWMSFRSVESI